MINLAAESKEKVVTMKTGRTDSDAVASTFHSGQFRAISGSTSPSAAGWFPCQNQEFSNPNDLRPAYQMWVDASQANWTNALVGTGVEAIFSEGYAVLVTSREMSDEAVKSALLRTYELERSGHARLAAQEMMIFIEKNLRRNGLVEANELLESADKSKLSSRSLIGLIRSTARVRGLLPAWDKAYLDSRKTIIDQGKNPAALFVGLPDVSELDATEAPQ